MFLLFLGFFFEIDNLFIIGEDYLLSFFSFFFEFKWDYFWDFID